MSSIRLKVLPPIERAGHRYNRGRVLAQLDHFSAASDQRVLTATLPRQGVSTLYARTGDLFGWLSVFGTSALAVWVLARRRLWTARG